jgi:hypothetical protein
MEVAIPAAQLTRRPRSGIPDAMETTGAALVLRALEADVDTLYAVIGGAEREARLGIAVPDREQLIAAGKAWISDRNDELAGIVCRHPKVRELLIAPSAETADKVASVLLVADLIATVCHGVPAVFVSTLLFKIGLREWCGKARVQ